MCERNAVAAALVGIRSRRLAFQKDVLLQHFGNTIGPGEYCHKDTIMSQRRVWEGLPCPIALHSVNMYKSVERFGVKGYEQLYETPGNIVSGSFLTSRPDAQKAPGHN
ncbi:hypothetical protein OAU26_03735 [Mariniblastus sp.]|nr:hypothetical protein [Mariniblastus sp.]